MTLQSNAHSQPSSNYKFVGFDNFEFTDKPVAAENYITNSCNGIHKKESFKIVWKNLVYIANSFSLQSHAMNFINNSVPDSYVRAILKGISGSIESGKMTALMGPSGAGKTVLLESLINKRTKGLSGDISLHFSGPRAPDIKMAVIPQQDQFFDNLTVKETIFLSSRLRNEQYSHEKHKVTVLEVAKKLAITDCLDTPNGKLRSGQRKKLAIATELVSQPNFLVLDECTTATDSYSAKGIVDFLHDFCLRENVAVLCSIHQPSWSIINKFDKLYMISPILGRPIFEGDPRNVISHLSTFGFECSGSAVDFITDIAAGKQQASSPQALLSLSQTQISAFQHEEYRIRATFTGNKPLFTVFATSNCSWSHFIDIILQLFIRDLKSLFRDRVFVCTIILAYVGFAVFYLMMFNFPGADDGCIPYIPEDAVSRSFQENGQLFDTLLDKVTNSFDETRRNNFLQLFTLISGIFVVMFPIVFRVPILMPVYWKEVRNGHYTPLQLFLGLTLSDISFGVTLTTMFVFSVFSASTLKYVKEETANRLIAFFSNVSLQSFYAQSLVLTTSSLFYDSIDTAIFFGTFAFFVQILFSGLMRVLPFLNSTSVFFSFLTGLRFSSATVHLINYGYSRCGLNAEVEGTERARNIANFIQTWSLSALKMTSSEGKTFFAEENFNLTVLFANQDKKHFLEQETKGVVQALLISIIKLFVTSDGQIRPIGLSFNGYSDDDSLPSVAFLIMWTSWYRILALLVLIYRLRQKF